MSTYWYNLGRGLAPSAVTLIYTHNPAIMGKMALKTLEVSNPPYALGGTLTLYVVPSGGSPGASNSKSIPFRAGGSRGTLRTIGLWDVLMNAGDAVYISANPSGQVLYDLGGGFSK